MKLTIFIKLPVYRTFRQNVNLGTDPQKKTSMSVATMSP